MSEYLGSAEEIRIETDERGFELHLITDRGSYVVNVQGACIDLLDSVKREIGPYWDEAEDARKTHVHVTPEDLEAYEHDDPKRASLEDEIHEGPQGIAAFYSGRYA